MSARATLVRNERGLSLPELLVAVVVFALFFLMIDGVFSMARRSTAKAELSADVQQNARVAVDRLIREIREGRSNAADIVIGGSAGARAVIFRSARPRSNPDVFCVDADSTTSVLYHAECFTSPGPVESLGGTWEPVWQSYIGYRVVSGTLRRYTGNLSSKIEVLPADPTVLPGNATEQVIASFVSSFDVTTNLANSRVVVELRGTGTQTVQGAQIPAQEIIVVGEADFRN